ncbi:hypothetical protein Hamer_G016361 [Homarus americanus]|uniref:Uncharacterized protein n=1 Tax=Homarus americanus TaxID=6706 RepID=A0A8J5JN21_HOMAM|nr:hypothetical protein Hamer_G016361 [Homarus americanus]
MGFARGADVNNSRGVLQQRKTMQGHDEPQQRQQERVNSRQHGGSVC